jgi:hypothetical protein
VITLELLVGAGPRLIISRPLQLPAGSTVAHAMQAALHLSQSDEALAQALAAMPKPWLVGVWNKKVAVNRVLQSGDRLELYRPLTVDPKVARRERFKKQGAKTAGLFSKLRAGAKAGY